MHSHKIKIIVKCHMGHETQLDERALSAKLIQSCHHEKSCESENITDCWHQDIKLMVKWDCYNCSNNLSKDLN